MGHKSLQDRRNYYQKNKDKINQRRREYSSRPEVKKKIREQDRKWRENNRQELRIRNRVYKKRYDLKIKNLIFEHYGKQCACCSESNLFFLSLDHINGGGTKHRSKIAGKFYNWIIQHNFPSGYQTLCFNCNWGKHINGGICPHKQNEEI